MRIRDAIHGDIEVSEFEERIVRTAEMQRLHSVRQLGSTYHVYPCALHTRFDHSLGVLHMSRQILQILQKKDNPITKDEEDLICAAALLHDMAHVSFGHTLETELQLVEDHDKGSRLRNYLTTGQIGSVLGGLANPIANLLSSEPGELEKPYQLEIIKDTISSDLLDYLKRDSYFCGMRRNYDERIISYFNIAEYQGKPHLVIDVSEDGAKCEDVIVEMEHLLRVRYTLGERVYNYHTKIAADAMIGKAIAEANISAEFFRNKGDEEVITYLISETHGHKISQRLAKAFKERRLFRRAYMLDSESLHDKVSTFTTRFREEGKGRVKTAEEERKLAEFFQQHGLQIGQHEFAIFCHEPEMNLKSAFVLVHEEENEPQRFFNYHPPIEDLKTAHRKLWRFYVFSEQSKADQVRTLCEKYFKHPSKCQP